MIARFGNNICTFPQSITSRIVITPFTTRDNASASDSTPYASASIRPTLAISGSSSGSHSTMIFISNCIVSPSRPIIPRSLHPSYFILHTFHQNPQAPDQPDRRQNPHPLIPLPPPRVHPLHDLHRQRLHLCPLLRRHPCPRPHHPCRRRRLITPCHIRLSVVHPLQ